MRPSAGAISVARLATALWGYTAWLVPRVAGSVRRTENFLDADYPVLKRAVVALTSDVPPLGALRPAVGFVGCVAAIHGMGGAVGAGGGGREAPRVRSAAVLMADAGPAVIGVVSLCLPEDEELACGALATLLFSLLHDAPEVHTCVRTAPTPCLARVP